MVKPGTIVVSLPWLGVNIIMPLVSGKLGDGTRRNIVVCMTSRGTDTWDTVVILNNASADTIDLFELKQKLN